MGWIVMLSVGALFSGLFLGVRDLVPYVVARRSGVIQRKGAREVRIRRDEDPNGFNRLLANRSRGAAIGFGLSTVGALGLSLFALALAGSSRPLAILIFVVYIGFALFAVTCLIRGFATGRMFAFWGLNLFGEASRERNPIWFWIYTTLNLLIVLGGVSTLSQAFAR